LLPYRPLLRLLHSRQSIWQLSATVRPPSCHGVPRRDVIGFHLLYFKVLLQIKPPQAQGME
jgi:hypothetical protein